METTCRCAGERMLQMACPCSLMLLSSPPPPLLRSLRRHASSEPSCPPPSLSPRPIVTSATTAGALRFASPHAAARLPLASAEGACAEDAAPSLWLVIGGAMRRGGKGERGAHAIGARWLGGQMHRQAQARTRTHREGQGNAEEQGVHASAWGSVRVGGYGEGERRGNKSDDSS